MTTHTTGHPRPATTVSHRQDLTRQVVVAVCLLLALAGDAVGSGAFGGTPIQQAAGGALSSTATIVAPAVPAFSIWAVIYLGLVGYTIVQFLPSRRTDPKHRTLGYPMAASLILNAGWILCVQAGALTLSVIVIALLLGSLLWVFVVIARQPAVTLLDAVLVDGAAGLYLGWVCVATVANITAGLTAAGFTGSALTPDTWGCLILAVTGLIGAGLAGYGRGRLAPAASLIWGISWITVARTTGEPRSIPVAVTAVIAAAVILLATVIARVLDIRASARISRNLHSATKD